MPDLRIHIEDGSRCDFGWPIWVFTCLLANIFALFEIFITPDMNDLVEGAKFCMPERCERRKFFSVGQGFCKSFFCLRYCTRS